MGPRGTKTRYSCSFFQVRHAPPRPPPPPGRLPQREGGCPTAWQRRPRPPSPDATNGPPDGAQNWHPAPPPPNEVQCGTLAPHRGGRRPPAGNYSGAPPQRCPQNSPSGRLGALVKTPKRPSRPNASFPQAPPAQQNQTRNPGVRSTQKHRSTAECPPPGLTPCPAPMARRPATPQREKCKLNSLAACWKRLRGGGVSVVEKAGAGSPNPPASRFTRRRLTRKRRFLPRVS